VADFLADAWAEGRLAREPGLVVAACDLPELRSTDVRQLAEAAIDAGGSAAFGVRGRAQLSLLALHSAEVARIARTAFPAGLSLRELVGDPVLVEPLDDRNVEDIDEPR
jgi:molybdopterin-guanine dinucleotide biosynthesis protein A